MNLIGCGWWGRGADLCDVSAAVVVVVVGLVCDGVVVVFFKQAV